MSVSKWIGASIGWAFLGPIGGLGGKAANNLAKQTDLAIAVGTKLGDFTTGSWANFENQNFSLVSINVTRFDAHKHMAQSVIGDAKVSLKELSQVLGNWKAPEEWHNKSNSQIPLHEIYNKNTWEIIGNRYHHDIELLGY